MNLDSFTNSIQSDALKSLAQHWLEVRGDRAMPRWSDIRPAAIKNLLPIVWSWRFEHETEKFRCRLAGDKIQSAAGSASGGDAMEVIFSQSACDYFNPLLKRVVVTPEAYRGHGRVYSQFDRFDVGERIVLPLADDGVTGNGVIGATDSHLNRDAANAGFYRSGEVQEWFALD
jgi:PAS domain